MIDHAVVLGMEDMVDGGQADVLVHAAVAGDEVGVQQFVVVLGVAVARIAQADRDVAVGDLADRNRCRARCRPGRRGRCEARQRVVGLTGASGVPETTMSSAVFGMPSAPMPVMTCAKPVGIGNEVAVLVRPEQRHAADVEVGQLDAQEQRLRLDFAPGRHAAVESPPPSISLPVATGAPSALSSYWRRNTWCEECEV